MLRIEEAMPPDYALNQSTKESGKDIVLSSIFGQKDDANSQGVVRSITNYHDERFIKAMNRCGGSLTESCRRSLLKVYKVSACAMLPQSYSFIVINPRKSTIMVEWSGSRTRESLDDQCWKAPEVTTLVYFKILGNPEKTRG